MVGTLGAIEGSVPFDFQTSDDLAGAFRGAANKIEDQAPTRASYVTTAEEDFSGHFADLFAYNAAVAASDATDLVAALRQTATYADELAEQARAENERRQNARDYLDRHGNWWEKGWDWLVGIEVPPVSAPDKPISKPVDMPSAHERIPLVGNSGSDSGTSSARPTNLRTFADGSNRLNGDLAGLNVALGSYLDDFAQRCTYGSLSAEGVVASLGTWLQANNNDVDWARDVAGAFEAAGGTAGIDTLSNATLDAVLAAAGVSEVRADLDIAMPSALGGVATTGYSMDPVNTATGNFIEPEVDLAFTGGAGSLALTRMYNSLDARVGVFGPGWSSILEVGLVLDDEGARWRMADGREVFFPRDQDGWDRGVREKYWLARRHADGDGSPAGLAGLDLPARDILVITDNAGAWWAFTPSGSWLGQGRGPGTTVRVTRDDHGRVTGLTHARGRSIEVIYAGGRVASVTACDGRRVAYTYDDAGQLTSVCSPAGERCYRWNDQGRIQAVVSAAGVVEATNTYDAHGRVTCQTSPFGRQVHFSYLPGQITQVSDRDGTRSNTWLADTKGRLIGVIDSAGNRQSMAWDHWGNLVTVTERDHATTVHSYDERGRRTRTTTPTRAAITYTYDDLDRPTNVSTEAGTTRFAYATDADRDPCFVLDPLGGRTGLTWSGGLLTRVVDPAGVSVDLGYDAHGDLISATNGAGGSARIVRDEAGRPIKVTTPAGHVTCYTYDDAGNLATRTDPDGATWGFEHTVAGQLSAIIDPTGARTELQYGPHGQLVRTIDPLGRVIAQDFDDLGNLATVHLPDGATWTYTHDALSRLTAVTDPAGGTWSRQYGPGGDLWATIDPTGVRHGQTLDRQDGTARLTNAASTTTVQFDKLGHPIQTQTPDGSVEQVTYDPCGNPIDLIDGEGGRTVISRDVAGRVVSITTPTGAVSRISYDTCGRPCALTDPVGAITTLAYDADSHLIARTFPTGEVEAFTYDPCGRLTSHVVPGGGVAHYRYDKAGHLTWTRDTWNGTRGFTYDSAGQLIGAVNGLGGRTVYDYDLRGRLIRITNPLGAITTHTYTPLGQTTTDPLGRTTSYGYDGAGRLTERTDPDGHTTSWLYDRAGRAKSVAIDGRLISTTTREAKTRRITVVDHIDPDHEREHVLEFNRRGQLTRHARGNHALEWAYDADGNRASFTGPDGTRTTYTHDPAGHLTAIDNPLLGHAAFGYDPAGRLTNARAGQLAQTWTYAGGYLTEHTRTASGQILRTAIQRDAEGQITTLVRDGMRTVYQYDSASELIAAISDDRSTSERRWCYDQAGHLIEERTPDGTLRFLYDLAGQLLTITGPAAKEQTRFTYDGLGQRTQSRTADGQQTHYSWGPLGSLSRITTTTPAGTISDHAIHTDALGELAAINNTNLWWDTAAPIPTLAAIGSIQVLPSARGLTGIGDVWAAPGWRTQPATANQWWDPNISTASTAKRTDPEQSARLGMATAGLPHGVTLTPSGGITIAGLECLRARTLDPATRGFLSPDPLPPVPGTTWSANSYAYAGNNPLALLDPTGLRPATDQDLKNWANAHSSHWEYLAGMLALAGSFVALAIPIPGLDFAVSGALSFGGLSTLSQKAQTGSVNWVAVLENAAIGAAMSAATAGAAEWTRTITAAAPEGRAIAATAANMGVNGLVGSTASAATYLAQNDGHVVNGWQFAGTVVGGAIAGAVGGLAQPAGGTIAASANLLGHRAGPRTAQWIATASAAGINSLGSLAGSLTSDAIAGSSPDAGSAATNAAVGGLSSIIPAADILGIQQDGMETLEQMPYSAPEHGKDLLNFHDPNIQGLWGSAVTGAVVGGGVQALCDALG